MESTEVESVTDAVTEDRLNELRAGFLANPVRRLASHALSSDELFASTYDPASAPGRVREFEVDIEAGKVVSQLQSGRCWLFATANLLRIDIASALGDKEIGLSENYLAFWDKFEKANAVLTQSIELRDRDIDDRLVQWILQGVGDGGQWDLVVNILEKHGAVPREIYPDTYQSSHSRQSNQLLNRRLRKGVAELRGDWREHHDLAALDAIRAATLEDVYGILSAAYGVVPETFDFEYKDADGAYQVDRGLKPREFAKRYVKIEPDAYIQAVNAPTPDKPFGRRLTVDYLQNVVEGRAVEYFNLPLEAFKQTAIAQLQAGHAVWFGADVSLYGDRKRGFWDDSAFDVDGALDVDFSFDKGAQLDYRESAPNHAMVFTGVSFDGDGKPRRWKVKNSWGTEIGDEGYFVISDSWFERFVYQVVIRREYVPEEYRAGLDEEVIHLKAWDPLGTLAVAD